MAKNKKHRILLAEDDPPVLNYLSVILNRNGYEVVEAEDGQVAIDLLNKAGQPFDLIIADLKMPNADGIALAEYNWKNNFLPFVVVTVIADGLLALKLLSYGVQDYLVKPIDEKHLITVVNNAINRYLFASVESKEKLEQFKGNVSSITVGSKRSDMMPTMEGLRERLVSVFDKKGLSRFLNFTAEFLLNAQEHGNLKIGDKLKGELLENDKFDEEVKRREKNCNAKIRIDLSILKNEVAVNITDEGDGFDYDKFLHMPEDELLERLEKPNGRGVYISTSYFDSISYRDGGKSVDLVKKIPIVQN